MFVLKDAETLFRFFCYIMDVCLREGVFPSTWKYIFVIPIPKSGSRNYLKDIRSRSILFPLSNVLANIVAEKLHLLNEFSTQSSFLTDYSCAFVLGSTVNDVLHTFDTSRNTVLN